MSNRGAWKIEAPNWDPTIIIQPTILRSACCRFGIPRNHVINSFFSQVNILAQIIFYSKGQRGFQLPTESVESENRHEQQKDYHYLGLGRGVGDLGFGA